MRFTCLPTLRSPTPISRSERSKSANIPIEKTLAKRARLRPLRLQTMKIEKGMETDQLKTPVERVRHAIVSEENRLAGLLDHPPIRDVCSLAGRIASGERKHRSRPQTPRTLTTNDSRLNLLARNGRGLDLFQQNAGCVIPCSCPRHLHTAIVRCSSPLSAARWRLRAARQPSNSAAICPTRIRWPRFMPAARPKTRLRKSSARRRASASSTTTSPGITSAGGPSQTGFLRPGCARPAGLHRRLRRPRGRQGRGS